MSAWGAADARSRFVRRAAAALVFSGLAGAAAAQATWTPPPTPEDLKAAMAAADGGAPAALLKLADSGRADAQYYAGVMLLSGRGGVARDPAKGCAYEAKAAATRPDAQAMVAQCYVRGAAGPADPAKAKAALERSVSMGYAPAKCALGQILMTDPGSAPRGLALCKEAADGGDVQAQRIVADAYFQGRPPPADHGQARRWYQKAADQNDPQAARRLGEMYASGDGGPKDPKKALELWRTAEKAGDPMAPILVADQLFSDLTGGKKPEPGTFKFKNAVPVADLEVVQSWYQEALERDPRPDVKQRATYAIKILNSLKQGAVSVREN